MNKKIIIIGAGGHSKVIADIIEKSKDIVLGFLDDNKEKDEIIIKEKPSVVFITGGPFYVLPIGRFLYDKYDLPYIIDLRDPWAFQKNKNNFKYKLIKLKNILLERYTFKKASCILTVNETMENMYKNFYPKYNFLTITNGYDEEDFLNIKPKQFNDFTIVYTGKFDVSAGFRDPSDLFKVIKELNNEQIFINFVHVGEVEQKLKIVNLLDLNHIRNLYSIVKALIYKLY